MDIYDTSVYLLKESQTILFKDIINLPMRSGRLNLFIMEKLDMFLKH